MSSTVWTNTVDADLLLVSTLRADYLYRPGTFRPIQDAGFLRSNTISDCYGIIHQLERLEQYPTICPEVPQTWSIEGLRHIAAAVSSSKFLSPRLGHRITDIHLAAPADLLDIAVSSLKYFALFADRNTAVDTAAILLFEWFANRQHGFLFAKLGRAKTNMLHGFVAHWAELAGRLLTWYEDQESYAEEGDEEWHTSRATKDRYANAILSVVESTPEPIITESNSKPLLETAISMKDAGVKLCRQLIRSLPDVDWIVESDLRYAVICATPDILEALMETKTAHWRHQLESTSGESRQKLMEEIEAVRKGLACEFILHDPTSDLRKAATIVNFCGNGALAHPCWAGLRLLDLAELYCPGTLKVHPDDHSTSPVVRIVRAARESGPGAVEALRSNSHVSEFDLELALIGASAARCVDVVHVLLKAGVSPDASMLVAAQREKYKQDRHRCRGHRPHWCFVLQSPLMLQLSILGPRMRRSEVSHLLLNHGATVTSHNVQVMEHVFAEKPWDDVVDTLRRRQDILRDYAPALICLVSSPGGSLNRNRLPELLDMLPSESVNTPVVFGTYQYPRTPLQQSLLDSTFEDFKILWEYGGRFASFPDGGPGAGGIELALAFYEFAPDSVEKARFLMEQGAVVDCEVPAIYRVRKNIYRPKQASTTTPLIAMLRWAASRHHREYPEELPGVLEMLLSGGADPNRLVRGRLSPLELACGVGLLPLAKMLLQGGAKIQPGTHPLRSVVETTDRYSEENYRSNGVDLELLRLVILACREAGMDMRVELSRALIVAAVPGHIDVATILLEAGADPGFSEHTRIYFPWKLDVCTAIEAAAAGGCLEMVQLLIEAERQQPAMDFVAASGAAGETSTYQRLSTALENAEVGEHLDVVEALERQLANFAPFAPEEESLVDPDFAWQLLSRSSKL